MRRFCALAATVLLLTGCGVSVPSDPQGTLRDVTGGTLKVGVAPNGDFVTVVNGQVTGSEAELVEAFAETIDADVEWTVASEEALVRALEREDVDLVIAGLTVERVEGELPAVHLQTVARHERLLQGVPSVGNALGESGMRVVWKMRIGRSSRDGQAQRGETGL